MDVLWLAIEGERAAVQVFPLRGGRMVDRYGFHLESVAGQDEAAIMEAFCLEYYGSTPVIPPLIVVPPQAGGLQGVADFLSDLRGSRVELRAPARGEKRRLQELASENATTANAQATALSDGQETSLAGTLTADLNAMAASYQTYLNSSVSSAKDAFSTATDELLVVVLVAVLLAVVALAGCTSYTGSKANQVREWASIA